MCTFLQIEQLTARRMSSISAMHCNWAHITRHWRLPTSVWVTHAHARAHTHTHTRAHTHTRTSTRTHTHTHTHVHTHTLTHTHARTHAHTHTHARIHTMRYCCKYFNVVKHSTRNQTAHLIHQCSENIKFEHSSSCS